MARIAIAQMRASVDPAYNFDQATQLTLQAKLNNSKLICLPENFNFIGKPGQALSHAEPLTGKYIQSYCTLARSAGIWMSLGGFQEQSGQPDKHYNTHLIISDTGEIKSTYRKLHLMDAKLENKPDIQESKYTIPGDKVAEVVSSPVGKLGLSICYDLRFPELFRALTIAGAEILLVPAAFFERTGYAHWEVLLRARAIENLAYVVASAQEGQHDCGRYSYGHSLAVDPWGNVVVQAGEGVKNVYLDVDLELLKQARKKLSVLEHVRLIQKPEK